MRRQIRPSTRSNAGPRIGSSLNAGVIVSVTASMSARSATLLAIAKLYAVEHWRNEVFRQTP